MKVFLMTSFNPGLKPTPERRNLSVRTNCVGIDHTGESRSRVQCVRARYDLLNT